MVDIARLPDMAIPKETIRSKAMANQTHSRSRRRQSKAFEYSIVYGVCYLIFFVYAIIRSPLALFRRYQFAGGERQKSIFEQARADANKVVPFIFMQ